jgi:hypothetical protein
MEKIKYLGFRVNKVVDMLNKTSRNEAVLEGGGIAPCILNLDTVCRQAVSLMPPVPNGQF